MADQPILIERDGPVVTLTLDRPEAANSFSRALLEAMAQALRAVEEDLDARAVVVTGAGERVFSAGADLKEREGMTQDEARLAVMLIRDTMTAVARLPVPTIAAVTGTALGGGCELALACDIRLASDNATFGMTETSLGIIPGGGGTQRLPRLIGPGRAKWMILSARKVTAEEAFAIGLVDDVYVGAEATREAAHDLAHAIARNAPVAVRAAKEAIDHGLEIPLADGLKLETELYERTLGTKDRLEGLVAFREKRAPDYRGE